MSAAADDVKSVFGRALELPDPAARAAYLAEACGDDASLRAEVEGLLAATERAGEFLKRVPASGGGTGSFAPDAPATATFGPASEGPTADFSGHDERVGAVLAGRYKLIEEIGEGGMGSVYMAQQTEPVKRPVAVKVIKAGMDSRAVLARFEAERQALAMMDHPNIARVLDAGTTEGGRPFFVMELVKGTPITRFCDERKLTPRQRLELFVPVCQAIQHAHQKGVVHRDIKPSNVIVAMYDDRAVPKVIDFGVAKAAGQSLTDKTLMTGFGAVVGTPEYMSPEQASLNNLDIDTRSDVYSLGVLLYELLTGTTPVDRKTLGKAALLEVLRIVREVEAPRPSAKLSTIDTLPSVAANRGTEPAKLSRLMRGELDWVVMKALEKDRARRYETANALARDVQRYLADELVEARPPSAGYRLRKFVRRHPLQLALAGAVALLFVGGATFAWWQNEQATARRETDLRRHFEDEQRAAADGARLARNAEAVAALLGQCEEALTAGDAAKTAVALDAARKRAAEGGAEKQAVRLNRLGADLTLLRELDAIDQFRWTSVDKKFPDAAAVARRTRDALGRFGVDPEMVSADEAAARVAASAVRERIVPALDRLLLPVRLVDVAGLPAKEQKLYSPQLMAGLAALLPQRAGVRALLRRVDADPYRDAVRDAALAEDRQKFVELADRKAALEQPPGFTTFLGESKAIAVQRRRQLLQAAVSRRPGDLHLLMTLASTYIDRRDEADAGLRWLQAAVAAAPANATALNNLGLTLCDDRRDYDGAEACFRRALELDPNNINHHYNLGNALNHKGRWDEAVACYEKAIERDPNRAEVHVNLGSALSHKGRLDEAIAHLRKAIELDPNLPQAHNVLGSVLCDVKRDYAGAAACFRRVVELDPKDAPSHFNLGNALAANGREDEAIACYEKALELAPHLAPVHYALAVLMHRKGKVDEAVARCRRAVELDPKLALAHLYLGQALSAKGQFADSLAAFKRAHELGSKQPGWNYPSAEWVRRAEAKAAMEAKLPAYLRGDLRPADNKERLGLAGVCQAKKLHHSAARLYADAFAADPELAADLNGGHRYDAACHAALAAAGRCEDAAELDDATKAKLRGQALDWLRADLAVWAKRLETGRPADRAELRQKMLHWQKDADLAGVRDAAALAELPDAEQKTFAQLWADVAALVKKAEVTKSSESAPPRANQ